MARPAATGALAHCRWHAIAVPRRLPATPRDRRQRTRWGSCSRISGIRLNWRLIHCPPAVVDYVVAHEVAHLVEMNHGPRFWAVVERLCPDHAAARAELRRHAAALPATFLPPA
jgi:predicted metal-dependent hydrolase